MTGVGDTANLTERLLAWADELDRVQHADAVLLREAAAALARAEAERDEERAWRERLQDSELRENHRARAAEAALADLASQADYILDTVNNAGPLGGYGYEHMGDFWRDVRPLCESLAALAAAGDVGGRE